MVLLVLCLVTKRALGVITLLFPAVWKQQELFLRNLQPLLICQHVTYNLLGASLMADQQYWHMLIFLFFSVWGCKQALFGNSHQVARIKTIQIKKLGKTYIIVQTLVQMSAAQCTTRYINRGTANKTGWYGTVYWNHPQMLVTGKKTVIN